MDIGAGGQAGEPAANSSSRRFVSILALFKPGIATGVTLAGMSGLALAAHGLPGADTTVPCAACILLAASGAGAVNVVAEAGTDARMRRLTGRATALGLVGRVPVGLVALLLIASSLAISTIYLNAVTTLLLLAAIISYTLFYTIIMKRRSPYAALLGGIPGALPVLVGYSAVRPVPGIDAYILFMVMFVWQQPHFLALALKYKEDYRLAGIPVMPNVLGDGFTKAFMMTTAALLVPLTTAIWLSGGCSVYFAVAVGAVGLIFTAACYVCAVRSARYSAAFAASLVYIGVALVGVIIDAGSRGGM